MKSLVLYVNDLRVKDHRALFEAMNTPKPVHACYILYKPALKKYGGRRNKFLLDTLELLEKNLAHLGVRFHILHAETKTEAQAAFHQLIKKEHISSLYYHEPIDHDEHALTESLAQLCPEHHLFWDQTLFKPGQILNQSHEPFRVFTPFLRKLSSTLSLNKTVLKTTPSLKKRPPVIPLGFAPPEWLCLETYDQELFPPGEKAAHTRLKDFLEDSVDDYAKTRDFFGIEGTSRLSPYLALGILSIRTCLNELFSSHERSLAQAQSGASIFFSELIWREFYRHIWIFFPNVRHGAPFREEGKKIIWRHSDTDLRAWQEGRTGIPIIDAAMRCFRQTGFMHNRLRMIVASFLTKNLLLDWHLGEQYFLHNLIDADYPSNNGGWQWSASVGVDPQPYFRVFNPITQSERYDENGDFIRAFVPELKSLDKKLIHMPKLNASEIKKLGYSAPLCDVGLSRKTAIERYTHAFRK